MAIISRPTPDAHYAIGATAYGSDIKADLDAIYADYDGNIQNVNIASNAAIADSKLNAITTAGKVAGSALASLTTIPVGAGAIPVDNIDTGTTANKIVKLDANAKIPAVDGSLITGIFGQTGSAPQYAARAWVNFDGTTASPCTIKASGNVTSVTKNGTGDYTINFTTAMSDANYALSGMAVNPTGGCFVEISSTVAPSASAVRIDTVRINTFVSIDTAIVTVVVFR